MRHEQPPIHLLRLLEAKVVRLCDEQLLAELRGWVESALVRAEVAISCVAGRQHGVVTWHQLIALGLTRTEIDGRCRNGILHRIHRGVYVWGNPSPARPAYDLAAVLSCGPGAHLAAASALAAYGLLEPPPCTREVLVVGRELKRTDVAVRFTAALHPDDHRTWQAIPITSPARAIVDYARDARPNQVADAVEQGQVKRLLSKSALQASVDRAGGRPGVPVIRELLADLAFTRSGLERTVLALIRNAGLPEPKVNYDVDHDEVDFVWPTLRLVLEVDGYTFHSTRRAFERDRRRDADRQRDGYTTLRATYREVTTRPHAFLARLAMAIARATDARAAAV